MTAINVLLQRDRGWLITDAAWYDETGVVHNFAPKSQAVGHWPGAIATRGPGLANATIATEAGLAFPDFDAFADGAAEFLMGWCGRNADHLGAWDGQGYVEVIAMGWSKSRNRPRAFFVGSRDDAAEAARRGIEAGDGERLERSFQVLEIETGYVRPMPRPEHRKAVGLDMEADLDAMDVLSGYGTRIVCAQRMEREPLTLGGEPVCFVGGYVMITNVDRTGVHMCKGAAFPDVVGRPIEATPDDVFWPHEDAPPVAPTGPPAGMTRQQRRAWEAQQRKKGGGQLRPVS